MTTVRTFNTVWFLFVSLAALALSAWAMVSIDKQGHRIERVERPPTTQERVAAAERALQLCARSPTCRNRFLLVFRQAAAKDIAERVTSKLERRLIRAIRRAIRPSQGGGGANGPGGNPNPGGGNPPPGSP